jgi:VWFA-related protein
VLWAGPFISINNIDALTEFPRIKLNLSVVDPDNRGITGLDEENILVYEDGYRVNYVKVKDISSSGDSLYLVFAIDSSKSISPQFLEKLKKNAREIVDSAGANDKIAVLRFNDKIKLLNNFSSNRLELVNSIRSVDRYGSNTLMLDAIYDSVEFLARVKSNRKGVVVFTDGKDEGSSLLNDDIIKFSKDSGVPVYFITSSAGNNTTMLGRIAKLTGGSVVSGGDKNISGLYRIILSKIRNIYEVYYQSIIKRDNAKHVIEVRLKYGDLKDRDAAEFITHKDYLKIDFPDGKYILLSVLIILLMGGLIAAVIFFFKKSREKFTKIKSEKSRNEEIYANNVNIEELKQEEIFDEFAAKESPDVMYSQVWLHHKENHGSGRKFQIEKNEVTIGSAESNTIEIEDDNVSEKHARIRQIEGGFYLYDLISDGGTYLNGKKLLRPKLLHDWDEIRVGDTVFIFRGVK